MEVMEAKMAQAKANRTLVFFLGATPSGRRPSEAAVFVASLCCSAIVAFGSSRSPKTLHYATTYALGLGPGFG